MLEGRIRERQTPAMGRMTEQSRGGGGGAGGGSAALVLVYWFWLGSFGAWGEAGP